jgi:hypothetical protein
MLVHVLEDYTVQFHYKQGEYISLADKLCQTFSFLRGRIPVIDPKFQQIWLHLTWVTVTILRIHHMIQFLLIMHYAQWQSW